MNEIIAKQLDAKVYSLKGWINLIEHNALVECFQKQLEQADFNILNFTQQTFPESGFTAIWLLAESHLAIHSFAFSGWTFFELTSCNQSKSKLFKHNILKTNYNLTLDRQSLEESTI